MQRVNRLFGASHGFRGPELVESARDHMRSALVLFDASPYCLDSAGYLSHLSIQLLLKVLLLAVKGEFPATHSVQQLFTDLQRELPETVLTDRGEYTLTLVDGWGELRYPRPHDPVEVGNEEVDLVISLFRTLVAFVPEDMRPVEDPSGFVTKHGRVLMRKLREEATPPNKRLQPTAAKRKRRVPPRLKRGR